MSRDGSEPITGEHPETAEIVEQNGIGEEAGGAESTEEAAVALPSDLAGWRSLVASLPARDLFRLIQRDRGLSAHLFAGFRPSADMLRHPVVLGRLAEDAQRHRTLGEALAALTTPPTATEDSSEIASSPTDLSAPPSSTMALHREDGTLKETIKKQKNVLREKESRIQEMAAQVAALQKERDAARSEIEAAKQATRLAREEAERERRLRERETRRHKEPAPRAETAEAPKPNVTTASATPTTPRLPVPQPFTEAIQRLINRGKYLIVAEICREALATDAATQSAAARGRVHSLLAGALYGLGEVQGAEDQDRLAANALLDGAEILPCAEAMARLFTQTAYYAPGSPIRQADGATLRRLLLLAERDGLALAIQEIFTRMRIGSAEAGRRLKATLAQGGKKAGALADAALGTGASGGVVLGPDEPIALPVPGAASVTARELVQVVDSGDAGFVALVRQGIAALRSRGGREVQLANALLESVTAVEPVAVVPLLAKTSSPVLVDASNVARYNPDPLSLTMTPRVVQLLLVRDFLLRQGFFPVILIADATLRFHVDDRPAYQSLLDRQMIRECAPGTSADEALLTEARARRALLVSNDRFSEWGEMAARVERQGFLIAAGRVALIP